VLTPSSRAVRAWGNEGGDNAARGEKLGQVVSLGRESTDGNVKKSRKTSGGRGDTYPQIGVRIAGDGTKREEKIRGTETDMNANSGWKRHRIKDEAFKGLPIHHVGRKTLTEHQPTVKSRQQNGASAKNQKWEGTIGTPRKLRKLPLGRGTRKKKRRSRVKYPK